MKKQILSNTNLPAYLLYGGLFMLFLRMPLSTYNLVDKDNPQSIALIGAAVVVIGLGSALRLYQQKQSNPAYLKQYLANVAIGVVIVAVMMATGVIHLPSFISQLF